MTYKFILAGMDYWCEELEAFLCAGSVHEIFRLPGYPRELTLCMSEIRGGVKVSMDNDLVIINGNYRAFYYTSRKALRGLLNKLECKVLYVRVQYDIPFLPE